MGDVDDLVFFQIVDKQIRDAMQEVETEMLPTAKQALTDTKIPLREFPIEGYYGNKPELTEYFNHLKSLQTKYSETITDSVQRLHDFYSHEAFGLQQAVITAINQENVWNPMSPPAVISPRVDPLTIAISYTLPAATSSSDVYRDLTIANISRWLEGVEPGKGLVGLGAVVDRIATKKTGVYDPIATTLARETTVLSAATMMSIGPPPGYLVSPEVEEQGNKVIDAYNSLFEEFGFDARIENVTGKNAMRLNEDLPDMVRVVRIHSTNFPGQDPQFYHWGIKEEFNQKTGDIDHKVIDFWRNQVVTTDMYEKAPQQYQMQRTV